MPILNLLFNPNGRINTRDFWRGVILLVGAMMLLQLGVYGGIFMASAFGFLQIFVFFPYLCVYGKRFHDSGRTAWFYVLALIAYVILSIILGGVLSQLMVPNLAELEEELQLVMRGGDLNEVVAVNLAIQKKLMIPSILTLFGANALIGFVVASLASDPHENQHGLPTG